MFTELALHSSPPLTRSRITRITFRVWPLAFRRKTWRYRTLVNLLSQDSRFLRKQTAAAYTLRYTFAPSKFEIKSVNTFFVPTFESDIIPVRLAPAGKADASGYKVRCATRYLVEIYVCHDSLLLGSQLIRIRLEPTTGNSLELGLKHTALSSFKFSILNITIFPPRQDHRANFC